MYYRAALAYCRGVTVLVLAGNVYGNQSAVFNFSAAVVLPVDADGIAFFHGTQEFQVDHPAVMKDFWTEVFP